MRALAVCGREYERENQDEIIERRDLKGVCDFVKIDGEPLPDSTGSGSVRV